MSMADEIQKLDQLRQAGTLTEDEFQKGKTRLLNGGGSGSGDGLNRFLDAVGLGSGLNATERTQNYSMWLHLSILANLATLGAGYVLPVVMWQTRKDDPIIDQHGRNALNFLICQLILFVIGVILTAVVYGYFLMLGVAFLSIVCPILVGLKAKRGIVEKYPLTIEFIRTPKTK